VVELRDFAASDGELIRAWVRSPEELLLWAGPAFRWPLDESQLTDYAHESTGPSRHTWTAMESPRGIAVGHASVKFSHPGEARVGRILIDPDRRGVGWGDALVHAVLATAFNEFGIERLDLGVFSQNTPAVRLYQRHGFKCHRLLRDVEHVGGNSWDAIQMRLTRHEYAGSRAARPADLRNPTPERLRSPGQVGNR
jgi:RimJ/RimL family protein N-acetyltransferase